MVLVTRLITFLTFVQVCQASFFMGAVDRIFGFSSKNINLIHTINGIISNPEYQCRLALTVKDYSNVGMILNVLPSLENLLTDSQEFIESLSEDEKFEMVKMYFLHLHESKVEFIEGIAFDAIIPILCLEKNFNLLKLGLIKKFLKERDVLIFFLKNRDLFMVAIKFGILDHLNVTSTTILAGKGVLHILAEFGEADLCIEILRRFNAKVDFDLKDNHFTKIEGNSILHSAVLSNNKKLIFYLTQNYSSLCGHRNRFGWSPLKLALTNSNTLESVNALLEFGCIADGESIFDDGMALPVFADFSNFQEDLDKLSKWSPRIIENFRNEVKTVYSKIDEDNSRSGYYLLGVLNSFRQLKRTFDRILDGYLIASPSTRARSRTLSTSMLLSDSPRDKVSHKSSLWGFLSSSDNIDETSFDFEEPISISLIINGTNFMSSSDSVKMRVLENLSKFRDIDFTGCSFRRLIKTLINHADPETFSRFVKEHLDIYFCIQSMFRLSNDYQKLVPYLDAIGFDGQQSFIDGLFPVHLAVKEDNLKMLKFLISQYNVSLLTLTRYERNNILHFGFEDRISFQMVEFLLQKVPQLMEKENVFGISPLQSTLMRTDNFNYFSKFIKLFKPQNIGQGFSEELASIYDELLVHWPSTSVCDQTSRTIFVELLESSESLELARLLLGFVVKKLLKHILDGRGLTPLSALKRNDTYSSPNSVANLSSNQLDEEF